MAETAWIGAHEHRCWRIEQYAERLMIGAVLQCFRLVVLLDNHRFHRVLRQIEKHLLELVAIRQNQRKPGRLRLDRDPAVGEVRIGVRPEIVVITVGPKAP